MDVVESDLPGVGKKYELELPDGTGLVIVTHNTGKREVFRRPSPDADSEKVFELSDRLARTVGTILEGAQFQPVRSEEVQTMLGDGMLLEWYGLDEGSPLAGRTLKETDVRGRTGATIVAIQRGDEVIPSPNPTANSTSGTLQRGDEVIPSPNPTANSTSGTPPSWSGTARAVPPSRRSSPGARRTTATPAPAVPGPMGNRRRARREGRHG